MKKKLLINEVRQSESMLKIHEVEDRLLNYINDYNMDHLDKLQLCSKLELGKINKITIKVYKLCN